ncbi:MAG: preprotein translocase subunit YajC [Actinomycetota bacterium]|nr:preprotein translocase subunit YajC [Actinomycetota bacterium]
MSYLSLIYLVFLIGLFYLLLVKPQQARVKAHKQLVSELASGDEVITMGGVHGKVKSVGEETVELELADNVVVVFAKNSILAKK